MLFKGRSPARCLLAAPRLRYPFEKQRAMPGHESRIRIALNGPTP